MKKSHKLFLIILSSIFVTYFIYFHNRDVKIGLVGLGDGIASGETDYNIDGISYNDYMQEYFSKKNLLKFYNSDFAYKNYRLHDLIDDINNNVHGAQSDLEIKQIIYKADILTLSIGEEELVKKSITNDLNKEVITQFLKEYDSLLMLLKDLTDGKIIIVSFYENSYLDKSNVIILNAELANLAKKYDCIFINISDLMLNRDYFVSNKSIYFNYKGHENIMKMIVHSV